MSHRRAQLFGMPLDIGLSRAVLVEGIARGGVLVSYLNPFAWAVARDRPEYPSVLEGFDFVACDGIAVRSAARRVFGEDTDIISMDYSGMAPEYLDAARQRGASVCLVGSRVEVVLAAAERVRREFPGLRLEGVFGGYGDGPDEAEAYVLKNGADLLLASMGMGRQESFLAGLRARGWGGSGIAVGGFFEKLADPAKEYPAWSERYNVRFLGRLYREPKRYLKRYTIDYSIFMKLYIKHLMNPSRNRVG